MAHGKYLFFVDSDDAITKTALKELFNLAEKFQADVVHTEKCFTTNSTENISDLKNLQVSSYNIKKLVTEPTLITENFFERAQDLFNNYFDWNIFNKFIRRDYWIENQIFFPNCVSQDLWAACAIVCSAKRYVRVPNITYIYRYRGGSISNTKRTAEEGLRITLQSLDEGFGFLDNFLNTQEFFIQNPNAKFLVLAATLNRMTIFLLEYYQKFPAMQITEFFRIIFRKQFGIHICKSFNFISNCCNPCRILLPMNLSTILQRRELRLNWGEHRPETIQDVRQPMNTNL